MKLLFVVGILLAACPHFCVAQSVVMMPVEQNPVFEVSTNSVNISGVDFSQSVILGADIVVKGGSGVYAYHWYTPSGTSLGTSRILTIDASGKYMLDITDTCDCVQTIEFNVGIAGIPEIEMLPSAITPNPTFGPVKITGFEPVQISVVNLSGRLEALLDTGGDVIHEADFSNLTKGLYVVTLTDAEGKIALTKLVKN